MAHESMSKSLTTGIIGGILGAIGATAVFTMRDEELRGRVMRSVNTWTQKGMDAAKRVGPQVMSLVSSKGAGEEGEKSRRVSRRAAAI